MPMTPEQRTLLGNAFRPHAPIEDPGSFVGRQEELERVRDAIDAAGLHVVLYGERGCGKTSLANVATAGATRIQVFCEETASFSSLLRDTALKYQASHPQTITFDAVSDAIVTRGMTLPASRLTGNQFLQLLAPNEQLCIVYDELDRVQDKSLILSLAELAKNAATNFSHLTLVMVGANDTADGLLDGHLSNFRNLRQVPLTRMSVGELQGILTRGEGVLSITFDPTVKYEMVQMSDRMPYYLHLLATSAARFALNRDSPVVEAQDLREATLATAQDVRVCGAFREGLKRLSAAYLGYGEHGRICLQRWHDQRASQRNCSRRRGQRGKPASTGCSAQTSNVRCQERNSRPGDGRKL
jgi:hypothetical protein